MVPVDDVAQGRLALHSVRRRRGRERVVIAYAEGSESGHSEEH